LSLRLAPFAWRHFPFSRDLAEDEIQQFHRGLVGLELRDAILIAEFVTLRGKLLKIGARIVETACRIKLALATACPPVLGPGYSDTSPAPCSLRDRERRGRDSVRRPRSPIYPTPTRSKSADRPSGKDATQNCVRNHVAKKIASALQLGE